MGSLPALSGQAGNPVRATKPARNSGFFILAAP
jgi:hypothetical protein